MTVGTCNRCNQEVEIGSLWPTECPRCHRHPWAWTSQPAAFPRNTTASEARGTGSTIAASPVASRDRGDTKEPPTFCQICGVGANTTKEERKGLLVCTLCNHHE